MRELTDHRVNPANDKLTITVTDEPGAGGAYHRYVIGGYRTGTNPSRVEMDPAETVVLFQNGPIAEVGVNGVTQEALLAILIDRLQAFQAGPFECEENREALDALKEAQGWLHRRTRLRMERGVEGTNKQ